MALISGAGCGSCGGGQTSPAAPMPSTPLNGSETLTITDKAAEKAKLFQESMPEAGGKQLRIAIRAGGCSGYSYDFVFDTKREGDLEIPAKDMKVLIDPMSMNLLKGSTVDYVETLHGSGFTVDNPNSSGGCGCGSSFSA